MLSFNPSVKMCYSDKCFINKRAITFRSRFFCLSGETSVAVKVSMWQWLLNGLWRHVSFSDLVPGLCVCNIDSFFLSHELTHHDGVIKWQHFPRYWPFVRGIHRSPVNSPHKGQWRGALVFSLICGRINGWVNKWEADDLRHHHTHYDVTVRLYPQYGLTFYLDGYRIL